MIYTVITICFFFDWICQDRSIAKNKGSDAKGRTAVFIHMAREILFMHIILWFYLVYIGYDSVNVTIGLLINYISHGLIDMFLPKGKRERWKINWTAIDQVMHLCIIFYIISKL